MISCPPAIASHRIQQTGGQTVGLRVGIHIALPTHLEAGVHELKLEVKLGDFTEVIERTVDDLQYLSDLTREIQRGQICMSVI